MNQSQIHPALRQQQPSAGSFSSPQKGDQQANSEAHYPQTAYSPLQPSPNNSYQSIQTPQYYGTGTVQSPDSANDQSTVAGGNPNDPNDPNDLKRPRACEACRQLKVKCEPDDNSPTGSCKRCAKANRQCVVTAPSRKRQKKTDSRVAELEKKIDALTASLVARGGSVSHDDIENLDPAIAQAETQQQRGSVYGPAQVDYAHAQARAGLPSPQQIGVKRKLPYENDYFGGELQRAASTGFKSPSVPHFQAMFNKEPARKRSDDQIQPDVVERGIIDAKSASKCFDRYIAEMCDQLPLVVFAPGTRMDDIRKTRPLLFLAILAVSSGTIRPDIQPRLVNEATKILADRIVYRGEKSMELVQTVQVMTIFYMPPERYEELNFNQLIHIAAVMALDIGMGKRSKVGAFAMWKEYRDKMQPLPDSNAAETRRCWLGCYYMCANSAMSLRRPLLIRWGPYSDECLEILATSPDALPSDKWLCHLVRAQHIAEDIGFEFSMDDPASQLSLTDPKTQYHLKAFERQLTEWRESSTMEMMQKPLMKHTDAIINLYMHEIAMHHNHNIDDFKPPYNITPIDGPPDPDFVTPAHIESLTACLHSIHSAFEAFLAMDMKTLRALPTLFFVRNSYAAVALIKMYSAVAAKGSKFGSIFKTDDLKVEAYLDRMIQALTKTSEGSASRVAYKFSFIFNMLKNWHLKRTEPGVGNGNGIGDRSNTTTPGASGIPGRMRTPGMKSVVAMFNKGVSGLSEANSTAAAMAWNGPLPPGVNVEGSRSSLQMLSDAAIGNSGSSKASSANTPGTMQVPPTPQQQWAAMGPPQMGGMDGGDAVTGYMGMTPGGPVEMDNMGFTSDELMAMGNLMEDPGWFGFGLEQGGWAF